MSEEELKNNTEESETTEEVVEETEQKDEENVEGLKKVIQELNDKLLRAVAENDNLRKRQQEELEKTFKYGITKFAGDLIPVMESLYLATNSIPKEEMAKSKELTNFAEGVIMTKTEMVKALEKHGIKRLHSLGDKFDPTYHQAIAQIESDEEEGTIVQVIQEGYMLMDRLLRPALVGVAKKK